MTITPDLELSVVEALRSDPVQGPFRAALLLLIYELGNREWEVCESIEEITYLVGVRWNELLPRVLEMAHRLEVRRPRETPKARSGLCGRN